MGVVSVEPHGFCARCSFRYPLRTLRTETVNNHQTSFLVCRQCWDPDQPQNHLSELDFVEVIAIKNPRPPLGLVKSRSLAGFDPVRGMGMFCLSGKAHGLVS
jgi:hypothetical protein